MDPFNKSGGFFGTPNADHGKEESASQEEAISKEDNDGGDS